jgi:uncharacterized membrane protein
MILGYDWPRVHAAVNDLPAALLPMAILFDIMAVVLKRDSARVAGLWCLVAGVLGGALAILAGEMAEGNVLHGDVAHAIMETHETFAIVVTILFGILAIWRLIRHNSLGGKEQTAFTTAGLIGIGLLVFTAKLGGNLVFDHAVGIDAAHMQSSMEERAGHHQHEGDADDDDHDHGAAAPHADSVQHADSARVTPPAPHP